MGTGDPELLKDAETESRSSGSNSGIKRFTVVVVDLNSSEIESRPPIGKWGGLFNWKYYDFLQSRRPLARLNCCPLGMSSCLGSLRNSFLVSSDTKLFRKLMKSQLGGFEEERRRHLATFPQTIHPFSEFRWTWDIFLTVILIVTLVLQPLQIAFYSHSMSHLDSALLNATVSLIFFIDILLNFHTGYIGADSDEVILNPRLTALHYFRTWFWVDFISTIPFDLIYIAIEDVDPHARVYFKFFRLLELLKILRLVRVVRYLTKIQEANDIPPTYVRLINLLTLLFLVLHWLACLHYLVADLTHRSDQKKKENLSWVSAMDLWDKPVYEKYLHCVLRALSNMGCLGYGFEAPLSPEDVLCTIISILIGATWFALFIANVSNIVLNLDSSHKKYDETLGHILEYMKFKHMPKELQVRVENYFEQRYRHNLFNEEEILSNLSSVLRGELQMFNCQHLVCRVPIFQGIPTEVIQEIVGALKSEVYLPRDVILWENSLGDSMYFIQRGAVEVLTTSGRVVSHLFDGNFFGEMALLTNERRRVATVVATTKCEIYSLRQAEFDRIVRMYPEVFDDILLVAKDRAKQITAEQEEVTSSAEETIRKRSEPQLRQSLHEAFRVEEEEEGTAQGQTHRNSTERAGARHRPLSGERPFRRSLDEILKMKPGRGRLSQEQRSSNRFSIRSEPVPLAEESADGHFQRAFRASLQEPLNKTNLSS